MREQGAGEKSEVAAFTVENRDADNVGWQHVAGKLNPRKLQTEQAGQGMRQRCFSHTWQVFDQQVAACKQASQGETYLLVLAKDDLIGGSDDVDDA